jgi:hypothetical protein
VDQAAQDGVRAKLDRADTHLMALTSEISAYFDGEALTYRTDADYDAGSYSVRVTIKTPPPIQLGVICGDYIHCLRSALDHLICGAVPTIAKRTSFPIHRDKKLYFSEVIAPAWKGDSGPLTGLDPEGTLFAYIQASQPYKGTHGHTAHPLWILGELSNADKHRAILTRASAHKKLERPELSFQGPDIEYVGSAAFIYDEPLIDGAEILSGSFKITGPKPKVQVQGHFPVDIAFGELLAPSESLNGLQMAVREVIQNTFSILELPLL